MAADGRGMIYMLQQNGRLHPIDAATGKVQVNKYNRKGRWDPLPEAVRENIDRRKAVRFRYSSGSDRVAGADVAAHGSTLVISFRKQDSMRWLSKKDGSTRHAIEVPATSGVAVGPDEQVFVSSDQRILSVDPKKGCDAPSSTKASSRRFGWPPTRRTISIWSPNAGGASRSSVSRLLDPPWVGVPDTLHVRVPLESDTGRFGPPPAPVTTVLVVI